MLLSLKSAFLVTTYGVGRATYEQEYTDNLLPQGRLTRLMPIFTAIRYLVLSNQ